jgi:hypothetical protein
MMRIVRSVALAFLLALLFQFFGMVDETFDARLFRLALFGSQRFAVVGDHQAGSSLLGFDIESGGGALEASSWCRETGSGRCRHWTP